MSWFNLFNYALNITIHTINSYQNDYIIYSSFIKGRNDNSNACFIHICYNLGGGKKLILKSELVTILTNLKINRLIKNEDLDELLLFLNAYINSHNRAIANFNRQTDDLNRDIAKSFQNLKLTESKVVAASGLSEKKIRGFFDNIAFKYDEFLFANYISSLNKKDDINKKLAISENEMERNIKLIEKKYEDLTDQISVQKNETIDKYNRLATTINLKAGKRYKRIDVICAETIDLVTKEHNHQVDLFDSRLLSVDSNGLEFQKTLKLDDEKLKDYYTSISLAVNKRIKELNTESHNDIEKAHSEYLDSLIPLSNNREYLETSTNSTKNDISYKYSSLIEEINSEYDVQKDELDALRIKAEEKYNLVKSSDYTPISNKELREAADELSKCFRMLELARDKWRLEIDKCTTMRKFEVQKADLILQTNLKKLEISREDRLQRFENRKKLLLMKNDLLILLLDMKRAHALETRDITMRINDSFCTNDMLTNQIYLLNTERAKSNSQIEYESTLDFYNNKAHFLKEKVRLVALLEVEETKISKKFELELLDMDILINRTNQELEVFNERAALNRNRISAAFTIQGIEQEKLLDDFLIEQDRNRAIRQNENKVNNLLLQTQKMSDATIISNVKNLINVLINGKREYFHRYLYCIEDVFHGVSKYSVILTKLVSAGCRIDTYGPINYVFISVVDEMFETLKKSSDKLIDETSLTCKSKLISDEFLTTSSTSFSQVESLILSSYSNMVESTVKNLEIQFSNLAKELEKTKIRISDLFSGDDVSTSSKWNDGITLISDELVQAKMIAELNQELKVSTKKTTGDKNTFDGDYNNEWNSLNQTSLRDIRQYENSVRPCIDTFKTLGDKEVKDAHRFKFQLQDLAKKAIKNIDSQLMLKESLKMNSQKEKNYLLRVVSKYYNETKKTYVSINSKLAQFIDKIGDIDIKVKDYHKRIKELSVDKATKNNAENMATELILQNKSADKIDGQIVVLRESKNSIENSWKKEINFNQKNLKHILFSLEKNRKDHFKNHAAIWRKILDDNKNLNAQEISELLSAKRHNEIRLDHLLNERNKIRMSVIINLEKKKESTLSSISDVNNNNEYLGLVFSKKLLFEDRTYQKDVRKANPNKKIYF